MLFFPYHSFFGHFGSISCAVAFLLFKYIPVNADRVILNIFVVKFLFFLTKNKPCVPIETVGDDKEAGGLSCDPLPIYFLFFCIVAIVYGMGVVNAYVKFKVFFSFIYYKRKSDKFLKALNLRFPLK